MESSQWHAQKAAHPMPTEDCKTSKSQTPHGCNDSMTNVNFITIAARDNSGHDHGNRDVFIGSFPVQALASEGR
jgi:hypothetical protein